MAASLGLVKVLNNRDIEAMRAEARSPSPRPQRLADLPGLVGHVEKFWQSAQTAKLPIEQQMLRSLRARNGIYEPDELAMIRQAGGSEIYMMLTSAKCRAAESWLREILLPDSDRPWGLDASPMPDLPPPVQKAIIMAIAQQAMAAGWEIDDARIDDRLLKVKQLATRKMKEIAKKIAERHELVIEDQLAEGGWEVALSDLIYDLVTFPAAIIKAPILRKKKVRQWVGLQNGQWVPLVTEALRLDFDRRSPFDIFPAASMRHIQRGNLIDRYRYTRGEIQSLKGVPGYSKDEIDQVLDQYGTRGYNSRAINDTERAVLELRPNEDRDPEGTIECLNFWGSCSGRMILEWGFETGMDVGNDIRANQEYQVEVLKVGAFVIKAAINEDPLGNKPYSKVSFEEIPGAFWGYALPDLGRDCQGMCNGSARAMANNASIASGPQVVMYVDRLADGERPTKPFPWKLYQMISDPQGSNREAVHFFQPQMNINELLLIYNHFERVYDNISGFPNYTTGDSKAGGAARTSSGLAQLMGNVGKGVRRVVSAVDRHILKPVIMRVADWNMENNPDPTIKGDLQYTPKGSAALLIKDSAQMRRRELLQATLNPLDASIIGTKGRAEMLRETIKAADMDHTVIVPDDQDLELVMASLPPVHQMLGKTGPNSPNTPAEPAGMSPGGGTPEASQRVDVAGNPAQGVEQREASLGFRDGGVVPHDAQLVEQLPPGKYRFYRSYLEDGTPVLEMDVE